MGNIIHKQKITIKNSSAKKITLKNRDMCNIRSLT